MAMSPRSCLSLVRAVVFTLAIAASTGAASPPPPPAPTPVIETIAWREIGLVVQASAPLDPQIFTLEAPYRFVVDLPDVELADTSLAHPIPIHAGGLSQVRMARKPNGSVRMVVDCDQPTRLQVVQLSGRSTLVITRADQSNAALASLFSQDQAYKGGGQEIQHLWSRQTADRLTMTLEASKPLTYSLFQEDAAHMQLRIPAGHFTGFLPLPGKCLAGAKVRTTPEGTWVLDTALPNEHFQLEQKPSADHKRLTLTWSKVEPRRFAGRPLVLIDPGHGGKDPGALGPGGSHESETCLALARALQKALWSKHINAMLTRGADAELYLEPRLKMIDQVGADLFVSLHANSHTAPDANGTVTFWRNAPSKDFATTIQDAVTSLMPRPDRGVKQERLYVLRHPKVPSLLLETGFISNPVEERLLGSPGFQGKAAEAITTGIERYLAQSGPARLGALAPGP
jgi:N-acetylmuramoyl-L-alanine amidase